RNREAKAAGMYDGAWLDVDEEGWIVGYRRHEERVRAHFADRPGDLLVMNITGGDGWEPLCAFLGHPVPDTAFPHKARHRPWSDSASATGWRKVVMRLRRMTASVARQGKPLGSD
ncbi:MAG TPA: sulfotransferase, partial [Rubrobacter sp.]|nr:sulfotransferase [Rubrobacter sp.]